jgi:hypothetical protein
MVDFPRDREPQGEHRMRRCFFLLLLAPLLILFFILAINIPDGR